MKSALHGMTISAVDVSRVSPDGFWLRVEDRDLFVAFKQFPWFENATSGSSRPSLLLSALDEIAGRRDIACGP